MRWQGTRSGFGSRDWTKWQQWTVGVKSNTWPTISQSIVLLGWTLHSAAHWIYRAGRPWKSYWKDTGYSRQRLSSMPSGNGRTFVTTAGSPTRKLASPNSFWNFLVSSIECSSRIFHQRFLCLLIRHIIVDSFADLFPDDDAAAVL